jgi:glucose-6-phosphate 1-dehydrogenase
MSLGSEHNLHHLKDNLSPTILTIFGATGDLSSDYLLPALLHMVMENMVPEDFLLVCVGRKDFDTKSYLDFIIKKSHVLRNVSAKQRARFLKVLTYFRGDFDKPESFKALAKVLEDREKPKHRCYNRLYYFATSPQYFASIAKILKDSGLLMACSEHGRKIRILVEKPFGFNYASAQTLNKLLLKYFTEDQIYRIDHYQGKETVQNLMVVRFANSIFEPLWNKDYIEYIEITVMEKDTAKNRGEFYDQTGALKDFAQNHLLQMLSLITMNEPRELTADYIRDEKLKILENLAPFDITPSITTGGELVKSTNWVVKGQYKGYGQDIGKESRTETYIAMKVFINTPRWRDVPIYMRTGKALSNKIAEVSIHFREPLRCIFRGCASNVLVFRIQPDESVHLRLNNKVPGFGIDLTQGDYEFGYKKAFLAHIPSAYERLLLDFMEGDQRLFIRSDEIEAAWKYIDTILQNWDKLPLYEYKKGSDGPKEADGFMSRDGREWWTK